MSSQARRRSSAANRSLASAKGIGGRRSSGAVPPSEQIRRLKDQITKLTSENAELKDRLRVMRKAVAPTTKVVKSPTAFTEIKSPRESTPTVKLPRISPVKREERPGPDLEPELQRLRATIQNMEERYADRVESLNGQLAEKIAKAKESSADINRLQALVRELQEKLDVVGRGGDKTRGLEATIQYLKEQLIAAQSGASTCAHIAKVNEVEAQEARAAADASRSRIRDANRLAKEAVDAAERLRKQLEEERTAYKNHLDKMKTAWTSREAEWQEYNARRNDQWKKDAAEWMRTAHAKLTDLQKGTDLLRDISLSIDRQEPSRDCAAAGAGAAAVPDVAHEW
eukprot:CAMPEP_0182923026 /NCGR_PEP_ID=MMETSP0105_2-20130417/5174_1 /TAXON_ID=81532 ORGANISM="Acanthoeca-like sp., Strain 10tr" /NCGR_SAMPLE_ID=MMETSP0105_2 /ASSEMBLY_ACC=CAM_ASM_000205 /LENGTH=340 /DNA_ID=CAMNT_0025060701 /DNA_START=204 /DNA_END=1223 /DNA_ORIENTATION=-